MTVEPLDCSPWQVLDEVIAVFRPVRAREAGVPERGFHLPPAEDHPHRSAPPAADPGEPGRQRREVYRGGGTGARIGRGDHCPTNRPCSGTNLRSVPCPSVPGCCDCDSWWPTRASASARKGWRDSSAAHAGRPPRRRGGSAARAWGWRSRSNWPRWPGRRHRGRKLPGRGSVFTLSVDPGPLDAAAMVSDLASLCCQGAEADAPGRRS